MRDDGVVTKIVYISRVNREEIVRFSRSRKDYLAKVCEKLAECAFVLLCVVGLISLFSEITLKGILMTVTDFVLLVFLVAGFLLTKSND
jgi:hypothetical protein